MNGSYSEEEVALCTPSDDPLRGVQCSQTVPPEDDEDFTEALQALFDSYSLGMVHDRTQVCPTLDERDPLNAYLDVGGEEVFLAMDTVESNLEEDFDFG